MKLSEAAQNYEPKKTLNIADLEEVSTDLVIDTQNAVNDEGEEFTYQYITVDGKQYRVPNSVISSLKTILAKRPNLKKFSVSKTGEGLKTKYTVVPLE